jgi:hypothetical protein
MARSSSSQPSTAATGERGGILQPAASPILCQACGAARRFLHRRAAAAAALLGHNDAFQMERAALVLATAALRLLTLCDHGEQQPGRRVPPR